MKPLFRSVCVVLITFIAAAAFGALPPGSPFRVMWDEGPVAVDAGSDFRLTVTIRSPADHYIYADETDVEFESLEGVIITDIGYPKAVKHADPYIGKTVGVFEGDAVIVIKGRIPPGLKVGERELIAKLSFRGCSPKLCFRPEETELSFRLDVRPAVSNGRPSISEEKAEPGIRPAVDGSSIWSLLKAQDFSLLMERGLGLALAIVFIAGILTSLTPCVWPVIPVVLLYVGVHPHKRFWENFALSATLVSGLVIVYAILGLAAVAMGKNFGFLFQHRIFLALVVVFFLAMSLSMFGVFDLRLPRGLHHRLHKLGGKGYRGAFLAGMGTGLVASPCAGPVLAALLGHVALQRNYVSGFAMLVVYGTGMGLLMVLLGACYGELAGKLKGGPWMVWVRRTLGVILLFPAAFYMGSLFHWSDGPLMTGKDVPGIVWIGNEVDALKLARETGLPVMVEFGAEWCPPCKALDERFLKRDDIVALSQYLIPFRVDATFETDEVRGLIEKYRVIGWPTVVFLNPQGELYNDLRVNSYDTDAIERGMKEAVRRSK